MLLNCLSKRQAAVQPALGKSTHGIGELLVSHARPLEAHVNPQLSQGLTLCTPMVLRAKDKGLDLFSAVSPSPNNSWSSSLCVSFPTQFCGGCSPSSVVLRMRNPPCFWHTLL